MKKIITSIILVGAFFVCAYTSESAETDKYAYVVVPIPISPDEIDSTTPIAYLYRIDKKTDKKEATKIFEWQQFGHQFNWQSVYEIN